MPPVIRVSSVLPFLAGKMEVYIEEIELSSLLGEVGAIIRPLVAKNGNTLETRMTGDIGTMRTDRTKLKKCLLNVLSNASKFTQDGKLTLAVERNDRATIKIPSSDTGIGISEEQLLALFH